VLIHPWLVLAALSLEAAVGYPRWLYRLVRHPVVWIGSLIALLERALNNPGLAFSLRRGLGIFALVVICAVAGAVGWAVQAAPLPAPLVALVVLLAATSGLAQRSLHDHVAAVATALRGGDLPDARRKVGRIVGRDVEALNADQVAAAAIESLAESSPAFLAMADHAVGWASARFDDVLNLVPARIAGLLIAAAGWRGAKIMLRDARKHASPNAGWPEAAMAGALGRTLGGAAAYDAVVLQRPSLGDGPAPAATDLDRALRLYVIACGLLWALLIVGGLAWRR
jgi:adenosylcobinamide-phosphate synthase